MTPSTDGEPIMYSTMALQSLKVNDVVGITRSQTWGGCSFQGQYTVTKVNKKAITLVRDTDKYERRFSVVTGKELGKEFPDNRLTIVTIEQYQLRQSNERRNVEIATAWSHMRTAVDTKNLERVRELTDQLQQLIG